MPLKIAGALLLCISGAFAGFFMSGRLSKRRAFLKEFTVFLSALSTEIRYDGGDIFTLVNRSAQLFNIPKEKYNMPFEEAFKNALSPLQKPYALTAQDMALIYDFGSGLGKTDVEGQLCHIELYQSLMKKQLQISEEEIKNKSKVYRALGIFAGVSLALVLI